MIFEYQKYQFVVGEHRNKNVIWVMFDQNIELLDQLRAKTKAWWSATEQKWYVTDNRRNRALFAIEQRMVGKDVLNKIDAVNLPALQQFQEQILLRGFSKNTLRTYTIEFVQLLYILKSHHVNDLTAEHLRSYFLYCHQKLKLSESEIHSRINAIKFYFEQVLHRQNMFFDIPRPKKTMLMPKILNKREIAKILTSTENLKHQLMLKLCYGMGLLVSEVVGLKIENIDSVTMTVHVENNEGKKDRKVPLPQSFLDSLRAYYHEYRPKIYVFEGQDGGRYSIRSVQAVIKKGMKKAKIEKRIGVHGLRHSYTTQLLETGSDIRFIQELLRHKSKKTTQI